MKYNIVSKLLFILILFVYSCSKEDKEEPNNTGIPHSTMEWIESTMRKDYLWNTEIPRKLNYNQEIPTFFNSMLSKNDGNTQKGTETGLRYYYSYIEPTNTTTKVINETSSYGFEFIPYNINDNIYYRVIYVLPNSPATNSTSSSKIQRGDWIKAVTVNGDKHLVKNSAELQSGPAITLHVVRLTESGDVHVKDVEIGPSIRVENTPFLLSPVFYESGQKIGYLVYNYFHKPGTAYDDQMRTIFAKFKSQGIRRLILDLRYNGGGYVSTMALLSSLIYPGSPNESLCRLVNNKGEKESYNFQHCNESVNIEELIVLTTQLTASASEAVINCLKPYMSVYVIGDYTEGKNVASREYKDSKYPWILHPIFAYVENKDGQSAYGQKGLTPDRIVKELYDHTNIQFKQFGDPSEYLLACAISHITGIPVTQSTRTSYLPENQLLPTLRQRSFLKTTPHGMIAPSVK